MPAAGAGAEGIDGGEPASVDGGVPWMETGRAVNREGESTPARPGSPGGGRTNEAAVAPGRAQQASAGFAVKAVPGLR